MSTWKKLCESFPDPDEPIIIKCHGKTFFAIREQDESDMILCQNELNGDFVLSINLDIPFTDPEIVWRYDD